MKLPLLLIVPPITRKSFCRVTGMDSPVIIELVDGRTAFDEYAINRHFISGTNAQTIAGMDFVKRDVLVAVVILDAARGLGRKPEERTDRTGRRLARPQLKDLAHQYQNRDDARGLKIRCRRAAVPATKCLREKSRRERGDEAVGISDAGAHRDQREHVQVARHKRLPAAHEEGPARPKHHWRRERKLHVVRQVRIDPTMCAGNVRAHFEDKDRDCERETDPEPPRHIDEFGIWSGVAAGELRLERHAADRAGARTDLPDLRVHRARVDGVLGDRLGLACVEIFLRAVDEFRAAASRAKIIRMTVIVGAVLGSVRIDRHAAHGIDRAVFRRGLVVMSSRHACTLS